MSMHAVSSDPNLRRVASDCDTGLYRSIQAEAGTLGGDNHGVDIKALIKTMGEWILGRFFIINTDDWNLGLCCPGHQVICMTEGTHSHKSTNMRRVDG